MTKKRGSGYVERNTEEDLARRLGWFSIGLGLAGLLAPRRMGRAIGADDHSGLLRLIAGSSIEWDAEIVNEHPDEMTAWRSCGGADVEHAGSVRFRPASARGRRGTVVKTELKYDPPIGVLGATVAKLPGAALERQIALDLLQFKQIMETAEIARTQGQPTGRKRGLSRKYDKTVPA